MPVAGGNPYLQALEEMAGCTDCKSHKRKYENTIQFLKHAFVGRSGAAALAESVCRLLNQRLLGLGTRNIFGCAPEVLTI
jgi:hypothetical protein